VESRSHARSEKKRTAFGNEGGAIGPKRVATLAAHRVRALLQWRDKTVAELNRMAEQKTETEKVKRET
jgi:hypothetical protein